MEHGLCKAVSVLPSTGLGLWCSQGRKAWSQSTEEMPVFELTRRAGWEVSCCSEQWQEIADSVHLGVGALRSSLDGAVRWV